jgi:hypothetical protein
MFECAALPKLPALAPYFHKLIYIEERFKKMIPPTLPSSASPSTPTVVGDTTLTLTTDTASQNDAQVIPLKPARHNRAALLIRDFKIDEDAKAPQHPLESPFLSDKNLKLFLWGHCAAEVVSWMRNAVNQSKYLSIYITHFSRFKMDKYSPFHSLS